MLWITADIIKTAVRHSHELWTLTVNFLVSQFGRPSPPKCSGGGFVFVKHDTVVGVLDQILGRRLLFQKHWSGRGKSSRSSLTPRDLCFSARLRRVTGRRPLWFSLRDFVPCLCPHTPSAPPHGPTSPCWLLWPTAVGAGVHFQALSEFFPWNLSVRLQTNSTVGKNKTKTKQLLLILHLLQQCCVRPYKDDEKTKGHNPSTPPLPAHLHPKKTPRVTSLWCSVSCCSSPSHQSHVSETSSVWLK